MWILFSLMECLFYEWYVNDVNGYGLLIIGTIKKNLGLYIGYDKWTALEDKIRAVAGTSQPREV